MSEITPEERAELREECLTGKHVQSTVKFADHKILRLLDTLEAAEKELAGADAETASLQDELEDSRGTEKDAPSVLCAIARLLGVYEHCQAAGDDMGQMALEEVQSLIGDKQKAEAQVARMTAERDWLAEKLTDLNCAMAAVVDDRPLPFWKEAARKAVEGEE